MGIAKSDLDESDVFIEYPSEDVFFRYDAASGKFFRKFADESEEAEVPHDNDLLNDAMRFGETITRADYEA